MTNQLAASIKKKGKKNQSQKSLCISQRIVKKKRKQKAFNTHVTFDWLSIIGWARQLQPTHHRRRNIQKLMYILSIYIRLL